MFVGVDLCKQGKQDKHYDSDVEIFDFLRSFQAKHFKMMRQKTYNSV